MHLWKHENGVYYVLYGPRGRRRISTKTTDKRGAEKFLSRFIAVEDVPTGRCTVGSILEAYAADKIKTVRSPEAITYSVKALEPLHDLFPSQLTPPAIRAWAATRAVSAGTIIRDIGVLRAALAWGVQHQWIPTVPKISSPVSTPQPRHRWITKDEARRLIAACRESHVRVFVTLGLMTCARSGAILEARWGQVDWERKTLDYGRGHGNKRRSQVPLNIEALALLRAAKAISCSDYIVEYRGRKVDSVKNGFAAACRRAGLMDVSPHILRHSGATWMANDGVPLREIARVLGDSEAVVERTYAKHAPEYLTNAVSALRLGALQREDEPVS